MRVLVLLAVLAVAACGVGRGSPPDPAARPAPPAPSAPSAAPATVPITDTAEEIASLKGRLVAAEARRTEEGRAAAEAKREAEERPLRRLLSWSMWAGGALGLLCAAGLGLSLTPWGRWIPGGTQTAAILMATGLGVIALAQACRELLALAWLPWAILAVVLLVVMAAIAVAAVRLAARHADRMERETTPEGISAGKAQSTAEQRAAGLQWAINLARRLPSHAKITGS